MKRMGEKRQLSRFEVLGAWLRLWTPPRDVEVPPVPWRAVGVGAGVLVVAVVVFVVVALPAIRDSNDAAQRREDERFAQRQAERNRRTAVEQAPHRAVGEPAPARSAAERRALVSRLEAAVLEDARARVRAGAFRGTIRRVDCVATPRSRARGVAPEDDPRRLRGGYDCTAVTSDIPGREGAAVGYPFQGVVDFRSGRLVWCKTNPPPGEQVVPDPRSVVRLLAACRDPGAGG